MGMFRIQTAKNIGGANLFRSTFLRIRTSLEQESSAIMKYWEIIADNLSKTGWSWGCVYSD